MMKELEKDFPLTLSKTKIKGLNKKFNLSNVADRRRYFKAKAGKESVTKFIQRICNGKSGNGILKKRAYITRKI